MVVKPQGMAAYLRAHVVSVTAVSLIGLLSLVIASTVLAARTAQPTVSDIPEKLQPGHIMPDDVGCAGTPYAGDRMSCRVLTDQYDLIFVTFDSKHRVIKRASMMIDRQTIGDLIRAWGPPTGIKKMRWAMEVQWGTRYVYVSSQPFTPENTVGFISYALDQDEAQSWKGFTDSGY